MIKKIVFDLDNTLLFISSEWKNIYQSFIDKYKLSITPESLYKCIGMFEKNTNDVIVTNKMMCDYINNNLNISLTDAMFKELLDVYKDIPLLYTDVIHDTLSYLSNKYELIAYTDWFSNNQRDRLKKYNLDKFFSKIYGWDDLEIKPSKKAIDKIIKDDNISEYLFIGDNILYDLEIPNNMGMSTIFYNRKAQKQDRYKEVFNLETLKEIL